MLRQTIHYKDTDMSAGTAFPLRIKSTPRPIIVTALHLFGKMGGYDHEISPLKIADEVQSITLDDAFTEASVLTLIPSSLAIAESAPLGEESAAGDIAAFWGPTQSILRPAVLSDVAPVAGDRVWLAARLLKGAPPTQRLHAATVVGRQKSLLVYVYDNAALEIQATSGAAVLNAAGEVVAVNLGGGKQDGKVLGIGNPVDVFRSYLLAAGKKPPPIAASNRNP